MQRCQGTHRAMKPRSKLPQIIKRCAVVGAVPAAVYAALCVFVGVGQRSLLYFPTHHAPDPTMLPWAVNGETIGFHRPVPAPQTVWLMLHGNGGQASDRTYVLPRMAPTDALYVLEYPGYGRRDGQPALATINAAAMAAYHALRREFPAKPIGILGESIGSGPASALASASPAPDKITLVVPFDTLANVAARHFPFLPVRLMLRDRWDNIAALRNYAGPVEIYAAIDDEIIDFAHAKNLSAQLPAVKFIAIEGGHNTWSSSSRVRIER
jgi:pimeloyl-ACP methyl ester carboxylesterase